MGRAPCCDTGMKRGAWSPEEDELLIQYISQHGHGSWRTLPKLAGLLRCGKSCRLRWTNYLRPDIKRGPFTPEEEASIIQLHSMLGNRWAAIASQLSGRTDNEIKNFWNTHLKKRLASRGHNSQSHYYSSYREIKSESPSTRHMVQWESVRVEAEARLSMESSLLNSLTSKTSCDHFLQLWNSGVGESFRKNNGQDGTACQSTSSQTSSSTKFGSVSGLSVTMQQAEPNITINLTNKIYELEFDGTDYIIDAEDIMAGSKSSSSYELDDASDAALKLLLDFTGVNDLGFL